MIKSFEQLTNGLDDFTSGQMNGRSLGSPTGVIQLSLAQPMIDKHGMTKKILISKKIPRYTGNMDSNP